MDKTMAAKTMIPAKTDRAIIPPAIINKVIL